MADDKVKRLIDFRKRTYALLSMQSSLESSSIVDIIEKAVESYVNPSIKEIVNAEYGEYEERAKTKRSGRPKIKKDKDVYPKNENKEFDNNNSKLNDEIAVTNDEKNIHNSINEDGLTQEEIELLDCYS